MSEWAAAGPRPPCPITCILEIDRDMRSAPVPPLCPLERSSALPMYALPPFVPSSRPRDASLNFGDADSALLLRSAERGKITPNPTHLLRGFPVPFPPPSSRSCICRRPARWPPSSPRLPFCAASPLPACSPRHRRIFLVRRLDLQHLMLRRPPAGLI